MNSNSFKNIFEVSDYIFNMAAEAGACDEVPVASAVCTIDPDVLNNTDQNLNDFIHSFLRGEDLKGLKIIGKGTNQILDKKDPTAHGELTAIRDACKYQNSERLTNSFLITTLEPCIMCGGAVILSRLNSVLFFAPALKGIGMKTLLSQNPGQTHAFNHYPELHHLTEYENQASEMLRSFFRLKRTV